MEEGKILDECSVEDDNEDIEMLDAEGELVEPDSMNDMGWANGDDSMDLKQEKNSKDCRRRANKKKNKRKRKGPEHNVTAINRFVLSTCRRLREKKSYMVYTAVGCLGVSALSDLVREVDAIQACGGQMTADGKRQKTGGGILWSLIKEKEPNTYKEIMKRAKEFEKQFKPQNATRAAGQGNKVSLDGFINPTSERIPTGNLEDSDSSPNAEIQSGLPGAEVTQEPIKDRIRVPISYEDIVDYAEETA